jgi:hypothetical protein
MEKGTFWNESSAASSTVTCVNRSADGRRPVARAKRRYDSPSDVAEWRRVAPDGTSHERDEQS